MGRLGTERVGKRGDATGCSDERHLRNEWMQRTEHIRVCLGTVVLICTSPILKCSFPVLFRSRVCGYDCHRAGCLHGGTEWTHPHRDRPGDNDNVAS
jgi:hypothetical protein